MATKSIFKKEDDNQTQQPQSQCTHHWVIDPPSGPISYGTCKKCGETKEFVNWGQITEPD